MPKRKERIQNPKRFLADGDEPMKSKKRSKSLKQHQKLEKMISSGMSSKIMKAALLQQKEVLKEIQDQEVANNWFYGVEETPKYEEDDDSDELVDFSETQSGFDRENYEEEINEEDERLLEACLSEDRRLADSIVDKIKEKYATVALENQQVPELDDSIVDIYKGVGTHLSRYTAGKIPEAFKHIPSMQLWEEVLHVTRPENWTPNAMCEATKILVSNLDAKRAGHFFKLFLLPRVREDIRKNKRLHFSLHQALKKSLYKPLAFFEGIVLPLFESRTCTLREAQIIGSIIVKNHLPTKYLSAAVVKLTNMVYCDVTSYFIKLVMDKRSALTYSAVDAVVAHFMRFLGETRIMPVLWHQSLLAFVQRYKNALRKEDKDNLMVLLEKQNHKLITPEIKLELSSSHNRGKKVDDLVSISSPVFMINRTIEEDRSDIPDVPMEED